jgi:ParB-like chromosome segregation protein Spo0J
MVKVDLSSKFTPATEAAQRRDRLVELQNEVRRLKEENQQLAEEKQQELIQGLASEGKEKVAINQIKPNLTQARRTIDAVLVKKRASSLLQHGQLTPILLIRGQDEHLLEDGELRWRAAQFLVEEGYSEWATLDAVFAVEPETDLEIDERSLLHNIHNEALNPLDRIEALFKLILAEVEVTPSSKIQQNTSSEEEAKTEALMALIRNIDYRVRRKGSDADRQKLQEAIALFPDAQTEIVNEIGNTVEMSEAQKQILSIFLRFQLNIGTVAAQDLRYANMLPDLKDAVRNGISCAHAIALQPLNSKKLGVTPKKALKIRQQWIQRIHSEKLGVREVQRGVKQAIAENNSTEEVGRGESQVQDVIASIEPQKYEVSDLRLIREALLEKLREIDARLGESTH